MYCVPAGARRTGYRELPTGIRKSECPVPIPADDWGRKEEDFSKCYVFIQVQQTRIPYTHDTACKRALRVRQYI